MCTIETRAAGWRTILVVAVCACALGCSVTPTRDNAIALVVGEYYVEAGGPRRRSFQNDKLFLCPDMRYVHLDTNAPGGGRREEGRWNLRQQSGSSYVFLYDVSDFTPEVRIGANILVEFFDLVTPATLLIIDPDLNNLFVRDPDSDHVRLKRECGAGSATP